MTRSTHLPSPTASELSELLKAAGWTAYRAAGMVGITASAMQQAVRGETTLRGGLWRLLQINASQAARDALPDPVLP